MSGGLFALLDDVAVLARLAAASVDDIGAAAGRATAKAAGVVIDDTAVTPQYVHGIAAERELPIIKRIAIGSLRNKIVFILPAIMLLSQFAPWLLTPILMLGATFLCYEGAEKVWGKITGHGGHAVPAAAAGPDAERFMVTGAIRTDLILSAEIMAIALNEVAAETFVTRAVVLALVGLAVTVGIYGAVALIVKLDDIGLHLMKKPGDFAKKVGKVMLNAMPHILTILSVVGTAAMLWVGGGIILHGPHELGFQPLYGAAHGLEHAVESTTGALGGVLGWVAYATSSALLGLVLGAVIFVVLHKVFGVGHEDGEESGEGAH